jgi:glycerol-3-phosphate dehydrogenase subunit B
VKYDCIITGGGISGLTCGIMCASAGLKCAVISSGMSATHFASGSIDLLGYSGGEVIYSPYEYIDGLVKDKPDHPYAKCGTETIRGSMDFFRKTLESQGLDLYCNGDDNHFHVTAMGAVRPTYFSQRSVFNEKLKEAFGKGSAIAVLNFTGFRDYYPGIVAANLKKNSLFRRFDITTGTVDIPVALDTSRNPHEFRSIDIARIFDCESRIRRGNRLPAGFRWNL